MLRLRDGRRVARANNTRSAGVELLPVALLGRLAMLAMLPH